MDALSRRGVVKSRLRSVVHAPVRESGWLVGLSTVAPQPGPAHQTGSMARSAAVAVAWSSEQRAHGVQSLARLAVEVVRWNAAPAAPGYRSMTRADPKQRLRGQRLGWRAPSSNLEKLQEPWERIADLEAARLLILPSHIFSWRDMSACSSALRNLEVCC